MFPVFAGTEEHLIAIGTGFFVGESGFFLTASHVARDFPPARYQLRAAQFIGEEPKRFLLRTVRHIVVHLRTDVAMGVLDSELDSPEPEPILNNRVALTSQLPEPGESIYCYSFPQTMVSRQGDTVLAIPLPRWTKGTALQAYPTGRDLVMQPGACVEADLDVPGGGSGGPVFNSKGQAFGVVSTGISGSSVTYIAPFTEFLDFPFAIARPTDGGAPFEITLRSISCLDEPLPLTKAEPQPQAAP